MTKKKDFPKLMFDVDQLPGCCGIGVVSSFVRWEPVYDWRTGRKTKVKITEYNSEKEQMDDVYEDILSKTWGNTLFDGPENYSTLLITLVSKYKETGRPQLPQLHKKLVDEGWNIKEVFINPNHGNEVTVYMKHFPERNKIEEDEEDFVDD